MVVAHLDIRVLVGERHGGSGHGAAGRVANRAEHLGGFELREQQSGMMSKARSKRVFSAWNFIPYLRNRMLIWRDGLFTPLKQPRAVY